MPPTPKASRKGRRRLITPDNVVSAIEHVTGISHVFMTAPELDDDTRRARNLVWWCLRIYSGLNMSEIARLYGVAPNSVQCAKNVMQKQLNIHTSKYNAELDNLVNEGVFTINFMRGGKGKPGLGIPGIRPHFMIWVPISEQQPPEDADAIFYEPTSQKPVILSPEQYNANPEAYTHWMPAPHEPQ